MIWIRRLEKVIFWLLYVLPYLLIIALFFSISSENTIASYPDSINEFSLEISSNRNQSSNIFSTIYDVSIFLFYGIGLLGIYLYLYNKEFFSKKFWIFILLILLVDNIGEVVYDIGEVVYNIEEFLISIVELIYSIYYYFTLYRLVRSYYE